MKSWSQMVEIWQGAGTHYHAAVVRADEYERDHAAVDAAHDTRLAQYKLVMAQRAQSDERDEEIAELKLRLADMTADYHRWHDAYLRLKYPGGGERIAGTKPCQHCDGSGVTASDRPAKP